MKDPVSALMDGEVHEREAAQVIKAVGRHAQPRRVRSGAAQVTAARIVVFAAILGAGAAQAQSPETLAWLRKMHEASQKLSYSGTFVYQQGARSETSRITRYGAGDIERLEVLD